MLSSSYLPHAPLVCGGWFDCIVAERKEEHTIQLLSLACCCAASLCSCVTASVRPCVSALRITLSFPKLVMRPGARGRG